MTGREPAPKSEGGFEGGFEGGPRRADDRADPLSPGHQKLYDRIERLEIKLDDHIASPLHLQNPAAYSQLITTTDRIVDALEGPKVRRIDGRLERRTHDGLIYMTRDNNRRLETLESKFDTGVTLSPKERATILAAAIGGTLALVGTIITAFAAGPHP